MEDGLARCEAGRLVVTPLGLFFLRILCMKLDASLPAQSGAGRFSRTVLRAGESARTIRTSDGTAELEYPDHQWHRWVQDPEAATLRLALDPDLGAHPQRPLTPLHRE